MTSENWRDDAATFDEPLRELALELTAEDLDGPARDDVRRALAAFGEVLAEDEAAPLQDPGLPSDYEVSGVLGRGASGVVYRAHQKSLARDVAVKVLIDFGDARAMERVQAEARRLAALRHPYIVQVHEVGRARVGVYITLQLAAGGTLQDLLREGPLRAIHAARLVRQVAEAVAYTHERGIVHLDLKPGNVLLDADGNAQVADFGLARELAGDATFGAAAGLRTSSGGLLGTPEYMSPEQAEDRRDTLDETTDVHGLGALAYACIAGRPPFGGASLAATLQAVRFEPPPRLVTYVPDVPRDLEAIVHKALEKSPERRYATARAMAQDLARFEAGQPVLARLPSRWETFVRWSWRFRSEAAVGVLTALIAVLSLWPWAGVSQERWLFTATKLVDEGHVEGAAAILRELQAGPDLVAHERREVAALLARIDARIETSGGPRGEEGVAVTNGASESDGTAIGSSMIAPQPAISGTTDRFEVVLDTWIVMDDGSHARLWRGRAAARVGERVRFDAFGRIPFDLPSSRSGFDLFGIAPVEASQRILRSKRAARVEAGGSLERQPDGSVLWRIDDREVWLSEARGVASTFVRFASDGLRVGAPQPLEMRRYRSDFGRQVGWTLLMFADARAADAAPIPERDYSQWLAAMQTSIDSTIAAHVDPERLERASPSERAAFVDRAIARSVCGPTRASAPLRAWFAQRDFDAARISDELLPPGRTAGVTTTGADLAEWLRLTDSHVSPAPGAIIDSLPASVSMQPQAAPWPRGRDWLWLSYGLVALLLSIAAGLQRATPAGRISRMGCAAGIVMLAPWMLDKRVATGLGVLELDVPACLFMALGIVMLARELGRTARFVAAAFVIAGLQPLFTQSAPFASLVVMPDARVPLLIALCGTARIAFECWPRRTTAWLAASFALTLTLAFAIGSFELGSVTTHVVATYAATLSTYAIVLLAGFSILAEARRRVRDVTSVP